MASERSWSHVISHLEGAIASIPRPNFDVITNPKEMAKRLKALCKQLKTKIKDVMEQAREMSFHVYSLLVELAEKIRDLIAQFFEYISEKVKSFLAWINRIIENVRARFRHSD